MDEILWCYHSNETSSAILSHGTIYLIYAALTFDSVDEFLWCDHSNESSLAEQLRDAIYYLDCSRGNLEFVVNFSFGHCLE